MGSGRQFLAAFAGIHAVADVDERKRVARQGLAMLAQIAEREPAPFEGLPAGELLLGVRTALGDGILTDLDWMSPAAGALALFELAQALPAGPERRELGRRVLVRLRDADRETFVRLIIALARSSPKSLASDNLRARTEVVLSSPLTAPGAIGELALGVLAQPILATSWVEIPATGSLPGRRLAGRILAHAAREAVKRHDGGDRGGVTVLARPGTRTALARLLGDREALVWRFACIARGLLAHVDSGLAADIDRELRATASSTELRRAAGSAAAALERGGAATRWGAVIIERAAREPGVARGAILGLAGLATMRPDEADALATALVDRAPLEATEALAELRLEEGPALLPEATARAHAWTRQQLSKAIAHEPGQRVDDARLGLLRALDAELGGSGGETIAHHLTAARAALDAGEVATALGHARQAVEEITEAADWLQRSLDDDPLDRRHSMRLLRELDRELFADNTLTAVLALAPEGDPARVAFARSLASMEGTLLAREARPEAGAVEHGGLRIARLRALVRLLDGVRASSDADLEPRLAAVRLLMERAATDHSSLRRAVWAALTRAGDALLRDGFAEITDLLLAWTMLYPDEDFTIVREASMVPDVEAAFEAYGRLQQATWAAADPDDTEAMRGVVERLCELADALPPEQAPRVESVRLAIARLGTQLLRLTAIASHAAVQAGTFDDIANELGALARRVYGARARLGLAAEDHGDELEAAARSVGTALAGRSAQLDEAVAITVEHARAALPAALAGAVERVFAWLTRVPALESDEAVTTAIEVVLPSWVPLSRLVGSFYVVRPIGRGAGGSVLLAVRAEERMRADRELVAVKVPDYGAAARNLSEVEFDTLFREEAGALLVLPGHANLARFVTFDASAQPKPILVMEFVRGINLERSLEIGELDVKRALAIIDDVLAGLDAMHAAQIAHLDVKPANVVLREGTGQGVLVDFGLAGRRLRPGCGSVHYGAREVWVEPTPGKPIEPFAADVYAAACVAFEVLTNSVLIRGDSIMQIVDQHFGESPGGPILSQLARDPKLAPLADLLRAAVSRDPKKRPTAARLRAGFAAIAPDLAKLAWPIAVG